MYPHRVRQGIYHTWIMEGVFFKLFAGYTPVCVQIDHYGLTLLAGLSNLSFKFLHIGHLDKLRMRFGNVDATEIGVVNQHCATEQAGENNESSHTFAKACPGCTVYNPEIAKQ